MYQRLLSPPNHSFFLFGPRATGKTTWLRKQIPNALWKNLLLDEDYLPLLADSSILRSEVEALERDSWVVIDEVQKVPSLLNEVHELISRYGGRYKFAMSGSSARKLRRVNANLLAGRALDLKFYPLSFAEVGEDFDLDSILAYGTLPSVFSEIEYKANLLTSYVGTYLKQEIQQEAMVEDIASFHRFLIVAGNMNGEIMNLASLARDASVARSTVERYFDILVDTLIGFRLPGWQPRFKSRERITPKFYLFDTGVVRALSQRVRDKVSDFEKGKLLETYILHELRCAQSFQDLGGDFYYWRTPAGVEVDFIWSRGERAIGIEIKSSSKWRHENSSALRELLSAGKVKDAYGVYLGKVQLMDDGVRVYPVKDFLKALHAGEILKF
jgi:predicted AAA+ superfamily ATPase